MNDPVKKIDLAVETSENYERSNPYTAELILWFSDTDYPELLRTKFSSPFAESALECVRGKTGGAYRSANTFQWTPAVQALAILVLRTAAHSNGHAGSLAGTAVIQGGVRSPACSLDYAIDKNTNWLLDTFGLDSQGAPVAKRLLNRTNPSRKRPGPVILSLNPHILSTKNITVYLGETVVTSPERLLQIAEAVEARWHSVRTPESGLKAESNGSPEFRSRLITEKNKAPSEIHYYTSADDLSGDYVRGLATRELDAKFEYIGMEAAQIWLDLCYSKDYSHYRMTRSFIAEKLAGELATLIPYDVNYISLGSGDGVKDLTLLAAIRQKIKVAPFLVDCSEDLLTLAVHHIRFLEGMDPECFVADFMQDKMLSQIGERIRSKNYAANFYCILGNTFGNYPQAQIIKVLRDAMQPGDLVLIGTHITTNNLSGADTTNNVHDFLKPYSGPSNDQHVLAALRRAGIFETDGIIETVFGPDKYFPQLYRVEEFFRFTSDKVVSCGVNRDRIYFTKGERILVGYSYKYSIETIVTMLLAHGLKPVRQWYNKSDRFAKILCQLA